MNIFALPAALAFTMNLTLCLIVLSFASLVIMGEARHDQQP